MRVPRRVLLTALSLAVAATAVAGCANAGAGNGATGATPPATTSGDPLGTWTSEDGAAWLTLADDELTGTDGCNAVHGTYSIDGAAIALDPGIMTMKACLGVTLSFSALRSAVVEDDRMTVYDVDGVELTVLTRD